MKTNNIFFDRVVQENSNHMLKNVFINFIKIFNSYTGDFSKIIYDENPRLFIEDAGSSRVNGFWTLIEDESYTGGHYYVPDSNDDTSFDLNMRRIGTNWFIAPISSQGNYLYAQSGLTAGDEPHEQKGTWHKYSGAEGVPVTSLVYDNETVIQAPVLKMVLDKKIFEFTVKEFEKETEIILNQYVKEFKASIIDSLEITSIDDYLTWDRGYKPIGTDSSHI